jgi:hypothetical protein
MTLRRLRAAAVPAALVSLSCLGCSHGGNKLYGSLSQLYDLSFNSVDAVLQSMSASDDTPPNQVQIQYISNSSGDPCVLTVDFSNIENVAGSSIDLTQLDADNQQPRGVLQRVSSVTTDFPLERGTITFDQVPTLGQQLSGTFDTTIANPSGYTLDGNFTATVSAP